MTHAGGRPTALTPQVLEEVRRLLPTCLYIETVADFISLDRTTVRKWLKRGAKEHQRISTNKRARVRQAEAIYVELFLTYKKALAEGLIYDLGIIKKAAVDKVVTNEAGKTVAVRPGQWQAAAWRAERRFPGQWGRKETVVMSDVTQRELDAAIEGELERLADARQRETAGAPAPENGSHPSVDAPAGPADARLPDAG
jgi:hypothetical protein